MTIHAEEREQIIDIATIAGEAGGKAAVRELLPLYGIDIEHPERMQELMVHLRFWTDLWRFTATKLISAFVFMCIGGTIVLGVVSRVGKF